MAPVHHDCSAVGRGPWIEVESRAEKTRIVGIRRFVEQRAGALIGGSRSHGWQISKVLFRSTAYCERRATLDPLDHQPGQLQTVVVVPTTIKIWMLGGARARPLKVILPGCET